MPKRPRRAFTPVDADDDPTMDESSSAIASATPPSSSMRGLSSAAGGGNFLLLSIAGFAFATVTCVARWILVEMGVVLLLLLSSGDDAGDDDPSRALDRDHRACDASVVSDVDADIIRADYRYRDDNNPRCAYVECIVDGRDDDIGRGGGAGGAILSIASSPILRSIPIVLFLLSSTTFVIGIVLARGEMKRLVARMRRWEEYGCDFSRRFTDVIMMGGGVEGVLKCMDDMVLDDALRRLARTGMELSMGALGGILLYSVPDELLVGGPFGDARSARRRFIRAVDPYLERILFCPGGAWDVLPRNLTEFLMKRRLATGHVVDAEAEKISYTNTVVSRRGGKGMALVGIVERNTIDDDSTHDGDDSLDSPMVSGVPAGLSCDDGPPTNSAEGVGDDEPPTNSAEGVGATIPRRSDDDEENSRVDAGGELLATTTSSIVVHEFIMNTTCLGKELQTRQFTETEEEGPIIPPPPELRIRQILHRTSVVAAFLFSCHLCSSPSTRRAWGSAVNLLTSLGLASMAIAAGAVSASLSGNNGTAIHAILEMLYCKVLEGSAASRDEIKRNKRLQTTLAIFALYWMRSLTRKGASRSCTARQQVGIK
ncbi:hypothetical protein ACHAXA_011671 [Cyclostephanos tholiformis]|uniref:Uncharacterized protein n=1 Tax=Cyclostephanos tholiformis TaxID=382380 RepID=A0ABD3SEX2_9STRA